MEKHVRTVSGALIQTALLTKKDLPILPNSTLNQALNIHTSQLPTAGQLPSLNVWTIGRGGHQSIAGPDSEPITVPIPHLPRHSGFYTQLPFIVRLPNNDLTPLERAKYRLRKLVNYGGTVYVTYWGKVIDYTNSELQLQLRENISGNIVSTEFEHTLDDLAPSKPIVGPGGVIVTTANYVKATTVVDLSLSATDTAELINACNIIYGSPYMAVISEVGLCTSIDRVVNGDFNGTIMGYTDAIYCQVANWMTTEFPAYAYNQGTTFTVDIGSNEPLLDIIN